MTLFGERIYLKRLSRDELRGNYISWLNDEEVCKYNSHGDVLYTEEMATNFIDSLKKSNFKIVYAVCLKENNLHIGNISLQQIDHKNNKAEIAYLFGEKQYWNRGYAKEASKILIDYAFRKLNLHRLYFGTHVENIRMQKLGEKLGFRKEGIKKEAQYSNNKYNDVIIYGLVNKSG